MNWYAVRIKPNQGNLVQSNLERLGLEVFCPLLKRTKIIRRKKRQIVGPLFPGYLFARLNIEIHFRSVNYSRGALGIVTFGSVPAEIDESIVELIKSHLEEGCLTVKPPMFRPGEAVRIGQGPLVGVEAIFEREMTDQERVILLLNTLSYQARIEIDRNMIMKC